MRFCIDRDLARTREVRERHGDVVRAMVQVHGFTYGMHAPDIGEFIKRYDNSSTWSSSFVRANFGVAIRTGEVYRNEWIRTLIEVQHAISMPRELADLIFGFENTWSHCSVSG